MEKINSIFEWFQNTLNVNIGGTLGNIIATLLLFIIGLWVAKFISKLVRKGLGRLDLDKRVNGKTGEVKLENALAKLVYYLLVIFVLMLVLNRLGITDVLEPLKEMMTEFWGAVPNIIAAGIIGYAGYLIAKLVSEAVHGLIKGASNFTERFGIDESSINLAKIIKQVLFIVIFVPILIAAVQKLGMSAISDPATAMLSEFLTSIPNIIGAAIIIGVFYLLARFISPAIKNLLISLKTDELPAKIGLNFLGNQSLSGLISNVVFFFILLAGLISGLEKLEMQTLLDALDKVMVISGRIFFGMVILILGNFVSNIAYKGLASNNSGMASIARVAILGIFFGMGLSAMGIADSIVNLAFGLTLGAVAVAVALSFGLGGREAAGKQMEHILKRFRKEN